MERMKVVVARLNNQEWTKYVKTNIRLEIKQMLRLKKTLNVHKIGFSIIPLVLL
jgi:hypothetical protein